mmetsp:Transcript_23281/g.61339  ORF Transcript_23281/g.61339 Transcript_23281/m.61339 type:complete len:192 (+) Transcript_23281:528-1103(+)
MLPTSCLRERGGGSQAAGMLARGRDSSRDSESSDETSSRGSRTSSVCWLSDDDLVRGGCPAGGAQRVVAASPTSPSPVPALRYSSYRTVPGWEEMADLASKRMRPQCALGASPVPPVCGAPPRAAGAAAEAHLTGFDRVKAAAELQRRSPSAIACSVHSGGREPWELALADVSRKPCPQPDGLRQRLLQAS